MHEVFSVNLVIHTSNKRTVLGITLKQPAQIMPIFLCIRHDEFEEFLLEEEANSQSRKVIIFDAMAIINKIDIQAVSLENCDEFASKFCEIINFQGRGFDEV